MRKLTCLVTTIAILLNAIVFAQPNKEVTGKITDANGVPVSNASVKIKNSSKGTSADANGFFKIDVADTSILVFSSVGYEAKELNIGSQAFVTVQLSLDVRPMSDVVVTGIGVATSKSKLGISVETVTADKLPAVPGNSVDQALVGKIPGAQIAPISGNPGDPVNILLRGINTVQSGTLPLILVDGVGINPGTGINSLDLTNIERVEVVQGAASSTIYGAQGANGVIQIFTKKGKKGPTAINFSTSFSTNNFLNNGNVRKADLHPYLTDENGNIIDINTGQPLAYNFVGTIEGISYTYGGATRNGIFDTRNTANRAYHANLGYYDHFKQVFQTGTTINNSLSFSGASDKSDFSLSVSNNRTVTPFLKSGAVNRSNLVANFGTELFRGFRIRSITQLIYTKNTLLPDLGAGSDPYSLGYNGGVFGFLNTSPFFDLNRKLSDGNYPLYLVADFLSRLSSNPNYLRQYSSNIDNKIDVIQSFDANYNVNKFLELDAKYGINYQTRDERYTYLNQSQNLNASYYDRWIGVFAPDNTGEILDLRSNNTSTNFLATAIIRTDFENDFHMNLPIRTSTQVSFDYRKTTAKAFNTYGVGLPLSPPINIDASSSQGVFTDFIYQSITYGYLINQKIDFGDFGGITAGFRSDWSSAFGGGSKPFTFPHFDGHLLLTSFFKNSELTNILSYFKIRAAYGEAGIQPGAFDRYPTLVQQNLGTALVYSIPVTTNNPDLQVEVSKEFEAGTDFTINTNKNSELFSTINVSFTYWKRKSNNVIYTVSIAPSNGSTAQLTNAIDMSSNGVQFSLNFPVYNSKKIKWDFTANFGHQVSVIDKISGGNDIIIASGPGVTALVLTAGEKIGQIFGYRALTSLDYTRKDGTRYIEKAEEDQYTMVDGRVVLKSTKQIQFTDEEYYLGSPTPKFNASFINSFSFKDLLILSFQFDWIYRSHLYNLTKEWMYRDGISADFTKPVTIDGETGAFTAYWSSPYYNQFGSTYGIGNALTKDFFYEDASFLRLRNLSLAFDLSKLIKVPYLKKLQLVLTGRNILTITKYTGFDPEVSSGRVNSAFERGVDNNSMPNIRSYQVGLNVGF